MDLNSFSENMETECRNEPFTISISAIKVDGSGNNSLKFRLCKNSLKSCDYIKLMENNILFIEFSDYYAQLENVRRARTYISERNISEPNLKTLKKRKILVDNGDVINNEIQNKISETLLLFQLIIKECNIAEHIDKNKIFIIALCEIIRSDSRVFDFIGRKLEEKFESIIDIKFLESEELEQFIRTKM